MLITIHEDSAGRAVGDIVDITCKDDELSFENITIKSPKPLTRPKYRGVIRECTGSSFTISVELYAHLHGHTDNSLLDGMSKVKDYVENTTTVSAMTDHGNLYGMVEFFKTMKKKGKKAIIAFEAYVEDPLTGKLSNMHTCLFAKDQVGYKNLLKLCSKAYEHTYRGHPHITDELLQKYHEGIIASSACLAGPVQRYLESGQYDQAKQALEYYLGIFGKDNFYLEVQRHEIESEPIVEEGLIRLSEEYDLPIICTTDSHYTHKSDKSAHEVLLCLQTGKTMNEPHMRFPGDGYWIRTSEEVEELFADHPEWLDNTLSLAERCSAEVPLGDINLPKFDIPAPFTSSDEYFKHLCAKGFRQRFEGKPEYSDPEYHKRYDYELDMIRKMGFVNYFLIVQDYIAWAREHDIYVGPGRGSAAGSLIAYCIGITDLDPIRFNLLFERFLNPERVSMPDIDVDFEHTRRQDVIDYVKEKYGAENVCHIVTFGTMAAKMAIKDVSRVMGYSPAFANNLAKLIPKDPKITIQKAFDQNPEFKERYETDADARKVIDIALAVEGCKRHASQHACGVVISPKEVDEFIPTSLVQDDNGVKDVTSQAVMTEVEELSLLKMDFLGLKNMTVIHEVIDTIKRTRGIEVVYQNIPLTDRETYEFLAKGNTAGVFQLESPGMTDVVKNMLQTISSLPDDELMQGFENLIAAVALYRPGPMDYIDDYIAGSRADKVVNDVPEEDEILKPTYGVIVYQEQVMQIVQKLAGFSMGRADVVRKAMGKKKQDVMDAEKIVFIYGNEDAYKSGKDDKYVPGCIKNGIPKNKAEEIWAKMENFAKYAFNRSHAACYAYIAYLTAYMSCHWPEEFYCGMLNAFVENSDSLRRYLNQADSRGIKILPPDINRSSESFSVDQLEDGSLVIRFGLKGLMGVGKASTEIVGVRGDEPFDSYQSFYERCAQSGNKLNKGTLESLIYAGALNCFGLKKSVMLDGIRLLEASVKSGGNVCEGQINLFDTPENEAFNKIDFPDKPEISPRISMEKEKEVLGFYLTAHPIDSFYTKVKGWKGAALHTVTQLEAETKPIKQVESCGIIRDSRLLYTKKSEEMMTFTLEDKYSSIRCVVFPLDIAESKQYITDGAMVEVKGSLRMDDSWGNQIVVSRVLPESAFSNEQQSNYIIVHIKDKGDQDQLKSIVKKHPGVIEVKLKANGRVYSPAQKHPQDWGIDYSPDLLNMLQGMFKTELHIADVT